MKDLKNEEVQQQDYEEQHNPNDTQADKQNTDNAVAELPPTQYEDNTVQIDGNEGVAVMEQSQSVAQKISKKGAVDLTVGSPLKQIVMFTLPLLFGNIFQLMYSWTDAFVLGNVKGAVQFAALSASMPVVNLLLTVFNGFLAGSAVLIGQLFGRNDINGLRKAYSTLMISILVITVIFGVLGFFLSKPLLRLLQVDEIYIEYSSTYLKYYFAGLLFMAMYNTLAQVLRCLGNSLVPLIALIVCVVLNIGLDCLFVIVFNMNIEGVAIGTMIAQFLSAVIMFVYVMLRVPMLRLKRKEFVFDKRLFTGIVRLGIPSTIQNVCATVGYMFINGIVNGNGAEFTAAFGLGNRIDELLTQINNSFGVAMSSYAAQNMGKGDTKRVRKGYNTTMRFMLITVVVLATIIFFCRNLLFNLFVKMDADMELLDIERVMEIANVFLSIYLPSFVLLCWMTTTSSLIRGTGAAVKAMTVNLFSFAVRVTSAFALNAVSIYGVFFASPIGWLAGSIWAFVIYLKGKWAKVGVVSVFSDKQLPQDTEEVKDER